MSAQDPHHSYFSVTNAIASGTFSLLNRLLGYQTDSSQSKSSSEHEAQQILAIHQEKKTLISKILTPELFKDNQDKVSEAGFSLVDGLKQGLVDDHCQHTASTRNVGFAAADEQFYSLFSNILTPLMINLNFPGEELDNLYGIRINEDEIKNKLRDFEAIQSKYIISCRVRVLRSLSGYPFIWACNEKQREDIEKAVEAILPKLEESKTSHYIHLPALSEEAMIKLTTVHGIYRSYWSITNHSQYASVCPDSDDLSSSLSDCSTKVNNPSRESVCLPEVNDPSWLSGRGFFCGYVGDPVLLVNEKEHLKFIIQQKGYNIVNLFTRLYNFIYKVEDLLKENGKEFALHETYGYLTSSPRETGSGLRISVILKLPLLMQEPRFDYILHRLSLVKALECSNIGVLEISFGVRHGFSECYFLKLFIGVIKELIDMEEMLQRGEMIDEMLMRLLHCNEDMIIQQ